MQKKEMYEEVVRACESVRKKTDFVPEVGVTLGSGLGAYAEQIDIKAEVPFADIEGFPVSTVQGHDGRLIFGYVGETPVVAMKGRVHLYEGYETHKVVLPARLIHMLGAKILFLTNAAGGVNPSFSAGDLMLITDHISLFAPNPLIGPNEERFGTRFPDMSEVYDKKLRHLILEAGEKAGVSLRTGIYAQCTGPSYEAPAEVRLLQRLGVDAVGMSTVIEAIAARHIGLRVVGVSCISNMAAGISNVPLSHKEVQETADKTAPKFTALMTECLKVFHNA